MVHVLAVLIIPDQVLTQKAVYLMNAQAER